MCTRGSTLRYSLCLDQEYDENIEGLKNNFSKVSVDDFVKRKFRRAFYHPSDSSVLCDAPIIGSTHLGYKIKKFVDEFLSDIVSEIKQDAITVYKHFLSVTKCVLCKKDLMRKRNTVFNF